MCWNLRSILNKYKLASTLQYLNDNKIMIACLTETWFDTMNGAFSKSIKNSGYEIFHSFQDDERGDGTAILAIQTWTESPTR